MLLLTVFCQFGSHLLMHIFTYDEAVVSVGATMLVITSWNFAANGIIFSCSSMFQGLGNTWPTIGSSIIRLVVFIAPALWLSHAAALRSRARVVRVGVQHVPAGRRELRAAAPGVPPQAHEPGASAPAGVMGTFLIS